MFETTIFSLDAINICDFDVFLISIAWYVLYLN